MEICNFLLVIVLSQASANLQRHVIESPQITNWGSWGELESCPVGTFVSGMQLKVEKAEGWKDDTGLNGIRLTCSRLGQAINIYDEVPVVISSSVGAYGEWQSIYRCGETGLNPKTSAIVGFQLKVEPPRKHLDDTSTNNFRVFCKDLADEAMESSRTNTLMLEGDGTHWGDWSDQQLCHNGYAICGIVTQIDHGRGQGYDDTALNNVRAECCKVRFHNEDFSESHEKSNEDNILFPDPIESAKEFLEIFETQNSNALDRKPVSLPEVLKLDHTTEHAGMEEEEPRNISSAKQETLDKLSQELSRLANINFEKPQVNTHFKITADDDAKSGDSEQLHTIDEIAAKPIVPPEVVQYIEAEINDEDDDPNPIHINVLAGSIATNFSTTTITPLDNKGNTDENFNNQLLVAAGSNNLKFKSYWCGIVMIFFATKVLS